jgi:acetoin utilization deacetylase AcuC-like enzyme
MTTGLLYDDRFLDHDPGADHPESADRLRAVTAHLADLDWSRDLKRLSPRAAELDWVLTTHSKDYLDRARAACADGAKILDSPDVGISRASFDTALLAAGGSLALADALVARLKEGK